MPPPPKKPNPLPKVCSLVVLRLGGDDLPAIVHQAGTSAPWVCHVQVFCASGRHATYHMPTWSETPADGTWRWP